VFILFIILGCLTPFFLWLLWWAFAPGPNRKRALARAQKLLSAGDWQKALTIAKSLRPERLNAHWREKIHAVLGDCHQRGLDAALQERQYEEAMEHASESALFLELDLAQQKERVTEAMLGEIRRLFAGGPSAGKDMLAMIERLASVSGKQPAEATFWQALHLLREGELEQGLELLKQLGEEVGRQFIDVPLYTGFVLHRLGRPQEALKALSEANRVDGKCPFVSWQMGITIMTLGGDSSIALRTLQRALGPQGLLAWEKNQDRLWVEAMPESRSYVRRLAMRYRYTCPILGGDFPLILRQGQICLAQAFYQQAKYQEAADLFGKLLQNSPPTLLLSRGYGLSLARLKQYDQAYKHLRIALDQEEPKDAMTAGYLALCGAMGRPTNPEDKTRNVAWSLRLLVKYPLTGNEEWVGLLAEVANEARRVNVTPNAEEYTLICDALASVQAHDPKAARAYSDFAALYPNAVQPIYAWLYAKAAATHGLIAANDSELFARVFQNPGPARAFFERQKWDLAEIEYTYLARSAKTQPGQFPQSLGSDYASRGEAFLLARSKELEQAGKVDPARESIEVLLRLSPKSIAGYDRLSCLYYRKGDVDKSLALLQGWQQLSPRDHWPLVRQAILEQERGNAERRRAALLQAMQITGGQLRAEIAWLGVRLTLREGTTAEVLSAAQKLLELCLREHPDHADALWCLAAIHWVRSDTTALLAMLPRLQACRTGDARLQLMTALASLTAKDYAKAAEVAEQAAKDGALQADGHFLAGWARFLGGEMAAARVHFSAVAAVTSNPASVYAKALLGSMAYRQGQIEETVKMWSGIEPAKRAELLLEEPLRQCVFLAGLVGMKKGKFEEAAERFREAGKLGLREKRLGGLITLALVKAGQRLLFEDSPQG
jgi:tetratricopeptide (TPR) repeat protein